MKTVRHGRPWLIRGLCLGVGAFALAAAAIVFDGLTDSLHPSDVGIVLGSKVDEDGSPSPMLAARLDRAVELYRRGLFRTVIVSGGTGKEGFDEAQVMKAYMTARRVPGSAIIVDSHGLTTMATAINSAAIMRARRFRSALVVTQYFHISRTRMALNKQGISPVYTAHARYFGLRDLYSIPREVIGYCAYLLR